MNLTRLAGMALAVVGLIVLLIGRLFAYQLVLYLGILVVAVGFVIYAIDVLKLPKNKQEPDDKREQDTVLCKIR
jgi:ABC-type uncharacterized transport system permease subunit